MLIYTKGVLDFYKKIVKCILPKGTIYYINNFDEIVSNQIRIIDYEKI